MSTTQNWRDELKQKVKDWNQGDIFKLAEGTNVLRILPSTKSFKTLSDGNKKFIPDRDRFFRFFYAHPNVGPRKMFVTCGRDPQTDSGSCWLCDVVLPKLQKSQRRSAQRRAADMTRKMQLLLQIAVLEKGKWRGPKKLILTRGKKSTGFAMRLLTFVSNVKKNFDDPIHGVNLVVDRTGQKLQTEYGEIRMEDDPSKVPSKIVAALQPLDGLVPSYDQKRQQAAKRGIDFRDLEDEDEDDLDDEKPPKPRHSRDDDDDDDDDDDGDSGDDGGDDDGGEDPDDDDDDSGDDDGEDSGDDGDDDGEDDDGEDSGDSDDDDAEGDGDDDADGDDDDDDGDDDDAGDDDPDGEDGDDGGDDDGDGDGGGSDDDDDSGDDDPEPAPVKPRKPKSSKPKATAGKAKPKPKTTAKPRVKTKAKPKARR